MTPRVDLTQLARRENEQTEWKENVADIDDVVATLCAFANDLQNLGGGYVVCGVREEKDEHGFPRLVRTGLSANRFKEVENVVLSRCRERVSPPLSPLVEELEADDPSHRVLVFIQPATGNAHTARRGNDGEKHFVRVRCSTLEARNGLLKDLLVRKGALEPWDRRPCNAATVNDIDLLALRDALQRMGVFALAYGVDSYLAEGVQLSAFVPSLCVAEPLSGVLRPRNFAILLFGRDPQRFIPGAFSIYSSYPGVDRTDPVARRFEIPGTLLDQARRLQELLDTEAVTLFDKTNLKTPNAEKYPRRALQEAMVNALAHRDYELFDPGRFTSYRNRVEFISPGPLPIGVTLENLRLGAVTPRWRNQALAWFLSRLQLAQAEGQGIQTIQRTMAAVGCPPPIFEATEVSVTCILSAHPRFEPARPATRGSATRGSATRGSATRGSRARTTSTDPSSDKKKAGPRKKSTVRSPKRPPKHQRRGGSMDKDTRSAIERATQKARKLLEEDFAAQLEGDFDVHRDGAVAANAGKHLSARQIFQRERIIAAIEHKRAAGMSAADAARDYRRDAAFTTLNRFVALKMLEARELVQSCITRGEQSAGYREFCGLAPGLPLLPDSAGYRLYLESLFDELSTEVKVLFDRRDVSSVLWPRRATFEQLLELLNAPELAPVWGEDETIGWVYQFFNGQDERRKMREESHSPRNSRELAVRNQFFTPRYVVQFLTDNTLGRIWYEQRHGETTLAETCAYMVRHPKEFFRFEDPRREPWVEKAIGGDWSAIPDDFDWSQSAVFAHVINGYELAPALGCGDAGDFANRRGEAARRTGSWEGSALELWICLFFEHRRYRHFGCEPEGEDLRRLNALCQQLRSVLIEEAAVGKAPRCVAPRPKKDPRDLRVLDPACGSGHFLLYAFELLLVIYEEAWADPERPKCEVTGKTLVEDYPSLDALRKAVPGLVLAHNLHGVDIDPRCAQIAQLALWMRAQKAYKDFGIARAERPPIRRSNIVVAEPLVADEQLARAFVAKLGDAELGKVFMRLVESLSLAGELGLLLRVEQLVKSTARQGELFAPPEARIRAALERFVREEASTTSTRRRLFVDDAAHGLALLGVAEKKFDVVLMNPPFGDGCTRAKSAFERSYPKTKNDIYAAFVERGIELLSSRGRVGAITSRTGFFLSSFQKWREEILLKQAPPVVFADLGAGVLDSAMVETAAYCLETMS